MTDDQLDQLDRQAAEKVMGWTYDSSHDVYLEGKSTIVYVGPESENTYRWQPTRNIAQAWELLNKMGVYFKVQKGVLPYYTCKVYSFDKKEYEHAETAPLAIVLACLRAKGVDVDAV